MKAIETKIVRFSDGTFFNGVKGHVVRKTKSFKDTKIISGKLSDRDVRYLEGKDYEILKVRFSIEILRD